jgi:hypothetical protein
VLGNPLKYIDPTGHWACDDEDENGKCINYEQIQKRKTSNLKRAFKNFKKLDTYNEDQMITIEKLGYRVRLTPEENALVTDQYGDYKPMFYIVAYDSLYAQEFAGDLFPTHPADGSPRNAFQHAFWNALLTSDYGENFAEAFTTAHETGAGSGKENQFMDLHNNEVGRQIALDNPTATPDVLALKVVQALVAGELYVLEGNDVVFSDQCSLCIYK